MVVKKGLEDASSYFFMGYPWVMRFIRVGYLAVFGWSIVIGIGGCARSANPTPGISVLPKADDSAERLVAYLETRHVRLTTVSGEEIRIEPGVSCRHALVRYLGVCQLRMKVCTENIANVDTVLDETGRNNPYRRQIVIVGADGEARIAADDSPFTKRFDPGHPNADSAGLVSYPNVNLSVEMLTMRVSARDYSMTVGILRRLDPTVVISEADLTDAFEESD